MTDISLPYVFVPDTEIIAAQANDDFNAVVTVVNGNLDTTNLSATAAITASQLSFPTPWNCGRLYGTSNSPYADTTSTSTLYFGPLSFGNTIVIENATSGLLIAQTFSQASLTITGLSAGLPYDVYASYLTATTVSLSTAAWGSATLPPTRSTDSIGRATEAGNVGALWVGVFVAATSSTTTDYAGGRYIGNVFNKLPKPLACTDTTSSWTYGSTTVRPSNGNTTNGIGRAAFICTDFNPYYVSVFGLSSSSSGYATQNGLGVNSTTAYTVSSSVFQETTSAGNSGMSVSYSGNPSVGINYLQRLESTSGSTGTFNGSPQCGLYGTILI